MLLKVVEFRQELQEEKHLKGYDIIESSDVISNVTIPLLLCTFLRAPNGKQPTISLIYRDTQSQSCRPTYIQTSTSTDCKECLMLSTCVSTHPHTVRTHLSIGCAELLQFLSLQIIITEHCHQLPEIPAWNAINVEVFCHKIPHCVMVLIRRIILQSTHLHVSIYLEDWQ